MVGILNIDPGMEEMSLQSKDGKFLQVPPKVSTEIPSINYHEANPDTIRT